MQRLLRSFFMCWFVIAPFVGKRESLLECIKVGPIALICDDLSTFSPELVKVGQKIPNYGLLLADCLRKSISC